MNASKSAVLSIHIRKTLICNGNIQRNTNLRIWIWIEENVGYNMTFEVKQNLMGVLATHVCASLTVDTVACPPLTRVEIYCRTCLKSHLQSSPPSPRNCFWKYKIIGNLKWDGLKDKWNSITHTWYYTINMRH